MLRSADDVLQKRGIEQVQEAEKAERQDRERGAGEQAEGGSTDGDKVCFVMLRSSFPLPT